MRGARCHQQASRQVSRVSSKLTVTTQTNGRKVRKQGTYCTRAVKDNPLVPLTWIYPSVSLCQISEAVLMAEYSPSMTRLSVPAAPLTATTQS